MDGQGNTEPIYQLPRTRGVGIHEPRPMVAGARTGHSAASGPVENHGRLVLSDIYHGRNMAACGAARSKAPRPQAASKPVNFSAAWNRSRSADVHPGRDRREVPVEPDGSANMELPACNRCSSSPSMRRRFPSSGCTALSPFSPARRAAASAATRSGSKRRRQGRTGRHAAREPRDAIADVPA